MPPRKPATRKTTRRPAARRTAPKAAPVAANRAQHLTIGIGSIVLGVLLAAYLIYGACLYLNTWSGSATRTVTSVFPYVAGTIVVPGYLARFLLTFLLTVLLLLTTFKLFYYAFSRRYRLNKLIVTAFLFLTSLAAILHGPTINDTDVSYNSYLNRVKSLSQFQEKQKQTAQTAPADASVDQIRAQSLQQLLLSNVIRQEATKYDVHVSRKEVNSTYKQYADRNQGEDNLKKQLKEFLGWTPAQFKTEIKVKLLEQKLNEKLSADDGVNKDRKQKAEDFLKQVKQDKKDFGEVAKQSDDPTAQLGGDPGFTKKGENDPALEAVIFNMNAGDISDIIKTQQGYVIVRLDEKQADQVKFRQILVKTRSLAEFIPDELKNAKVGVYVKDLGWDKSLTAVQSKNQPSQQPTESTSPAPEASAAPAPAAQ